jgi:hypothetical protein
VTNEGFERETRNIPTVHTTNLRNAQDQTCISLTPPAVAQHNPTP